MTAQPMDPKDVPETALLDALITHYDGGEWLGDFDDATIAEMRTILAAAIPAIRAQVADEIARDICEPMDDCDRPSCPDCIRHEYAQRLARRIRGDQ